MPRSRARRSGADPVGARLPDARCACSRIGASSPSASSSSPTTTSRPTSSTANCPGRVLVGQLIRHGPAARLDAVSCAPAFRSPASRCDPIGLAAVHAAAARRRRSTSSSSCCCSSRRTAPTARPPLRRRPHRRRARGPRVRRLRLHRVSAETSRDRLHGRLAAGGTAADRSRRSRRSPTSTARRAFYMGAVRPGLRGAGALRLPAVGLHLRAGLRRVRAVPRRSAHRRRARSAVTMAACCSAASRVATALGAAAGAVVLLPLVEARKRLGSRGGARLGLVDAPRVLAAELLTFFAPYIHGDISNNTYSGPPFFWEDYGYVGLATALLAIYGRRSRAAAAGRRVHRVHDGARAISSCSARRRRCSTSPTC